MQVPNSQEQSEANSYSPRSTTPSKHLPKHLPPLTSQTPPQYWQVPPGLQFDSSLQIQFQMNKIPIEEQARPINRRDQQHSSEANDQPQELNFVPKGRRKEAITITYRGIIQKGNIHLNSSLNLLYTTVIAQNWKLCHGQKSGISQRTFHNGQQFVWNFPFQMTFETVRPQNWPQIVVVLYGKDFFGRSVAKGYGNLHLPCSAGTHTRTMRLFDSIPPSNTASCCAFLQGYINQLKQPEKVLTTEDRSFIQTKPIGELTIKVEVRRYNFEEYGFD